MSESTYVFFIVTTFWSLSTILAFFWNRQTWVDKFLYSVSIPSKTFCATKNPRTLNLWDWVLVVNGKICRFYLETRFFAFKSISQQNHSWRNTVLHLTLQEHSNTPSSGIKTSPLVAKPEQLCWFPYAYWIPPTQLTNQLEEEARDRLHGTQKTRRSLQKWPAIYTQWQGKRSEDWPPGKELKYT